MTDSTNAQYLEAGARYVTETLGVAPTRAAVLALAATMAGCGVRAETIVSETERVLSMDQRPEHRAQAVKGLVVRDRNALAERALAAVSSIAAAEEAMEFTALSNAAGNARRNSIHTRVDTEAGRDAFRRWFADHNGVANLYFGAQRRAEGVSGAARADQIAAYRALPLDFDQRDGETQAQFEARATDLVHKLVPLGPALVVRTGSGGVQVSFRCREITDRAEMNAVAQVWNALCAAVGSDRVGDPPRVLRLPFSLNVPGAGKRRRGRTVALAHLLAPASAEATDWDPPALARAVARALGAPERASGTSQGGAPTARRGSRRDRIAGSVELIRRAVAAIPNDAEFDAYDAFEAMGEAIKGAAGDDPGGLEIWLDFCARSETHHNDPDLMEAKYWSFGADHAGWASILRRVAERDADLAETFRREGAKFKFGAITPDDDDRADTLADEAAKDAARSAALLAEIAKDHAIIRGFKGIANLRGTATRLISFEPRDVFTQFWDQQGTLPVKGKHIPAGRAMFSGPGMLPTFEGVGMWVPGAEPAGHLNLFPGFAVPSVPGSWSTIDEYLLLVLASGDPARYGFLLDWLAYCVQNPLGRALTVLCLVGLPGCGKSTLGKLMRMIFGHRLTIAATSEADLFGTFNSRLEHALFIHADEAFFGPDPRIRSTFKALVTEPTLRIEEKHETAREVPNRTKMLVTSNEAAALPLEPRDRRSTVFTVSDAWIGDKPRWDALHRAIDTGGEAEAFLHALLHRDLTKFNPRRPHGTLDKVQMALAGSDPVTQFIKSAIDRGALPGADLTAELSGKGRPDWSAGPVTVLRSEFFDEFERWAGARQRRASFIPNATAFGAKLRSLIPDINRGAQKARIGGTAQNVYAFPSLDETERALLAALGAGDEAQQEGGTASEGGGTERS